MEVNNSGRNLFATAHYKMELQISYSICTEVQEKSFLQRKEGRGRKNTENPVRAEKDQDYRSRSVSRPRTYAAGNTAKGIGIELHGVPEREKQFNDL